MQWVKALSHHDPVFNAVFEQHGWEGYGLAQAMLSEAYSQGITDIDVMHLKRWLKIHNKKAEKLLPEFRQILAKFWQNLGKISGKLVKNDASNPGPDRTLIERKKEKKDIPPLNPPTGGSAPFEKFWQAYPRRVAKRKCYGIWTRKRLDRHLDAIMRGLNAHKTSEQWRSGYIPHPSTFLNQERWDDELGTDLPPPPPSPYDKTTVVDRLLSHPFIRSRDDPTDIIPTSQLERTSSNVVLHNGRVLPVMEYEGTHDGSHTRKPVSS